MRAHPDGHHLRLLFQGRHIGAIMYRLISFAVLLLALHCALTMPDHPASMRMSGELSHEMDMHNDTAANNATATAATSGEDEDDDNAEDDANEEEDDDDDEIHVEGKSSSCPPRLPEVVEIEQQCMTEYRAMKEDGTCMEKPTKDIFVIEKEAPNAATIRLETVPDSASSEESTDSPGHKHRAHMSFYYHCLLKKLDWLNEVEGPSKPKIQAWIATNVTDATQKEQTQERLNHCLIKMFDETEVTESSTETTEETEKSTETSSKKQEQMKCDTSKTLVCCLHHVECPVIKYP